MLIGLRRFFFLGATYIPRKVVIELSLIEESSLKSKDEILKEISEVFSNEELVIPWCDKVENIRISN